MDDTVLAIQRLYPQIYLACHQRHSRARSNEHRVSERDHALLAHLSKEHGLRSSELAKHVGIGRPTMSEAIKRLERLGYAERRRSGADRRAVQLFLTARGAAALQGTSVLDTGRLRKAVERLDEQERRAAVEGLALLARAARELSAKEPKR